MKHACVCELSTQVRVLEKKTERGTGPADGPGGANGVKPVVLLPSTVPPLFFCFLPSFSFLNREPTHRQYGGTSQKRAGIGDLSRQDNGRVQSRKGSRGRVQSGP